MEDSVETYLQEFSFCSWNKNGKFFRRHENREKEKYRWFVCNLTPSSIRFFFFFSFFKYYNNWWLLMRYFSSFALSRDREPKSIPPFCSFIRLSCSNIVFINFFLFFANSYIYIFFNGSINYNCNTDWNELNNFVDFGEKKCFCQIVMGIQYFCIW